MDKEPNNNSTLANMRLKKKLVLRVRRNNRTCFAKENEQLSKNLITGIYLTY